MEQASKLKEKKLVQKIIQKDEKSLLLFYRDYKILLFNFVQRQLRDVHLAEEVTQDTFYDFIEALRDFQGHCSLKTYLFSIAKNKIADVMRKKKLKKILFSALPTYVIEGLKTVIIDEELNKHELAQKIKNVLDRLPNDYRMVLRLKYMEGEKVTNIAAKMSLGFKATESLIFRARKAFIKVFQELP